MNFKISPPFSSNLRMSESTKTFKNFVNSNHNIKVNRGNAFSTELGNS